MSSKFQDEQRSGISKIDEDYVEMRILRAARELRRAEDGLRAAFDALNCKSVIDSLKGVEIGRFGSLKDMLDELASHGILSVWHAAEALEVFAADHQLDRDGNRLAKCICFHAPEQHGEDGCEALDPMSTHSVRISCTCRWTGFKGDGQ